MLKKKLISYWIIFKTYAWLLTADKGRPKFYKFPRDENLNSNGS